MVFLRVSSLMPLLLAATVSPAATLEDEAVELRGRAIANLAALSTLKIECRLATSPIGADHHPTGSIRERRESLDWSRSAGRLRRRRTDVPASGYAVDLPAKKLLRARGTTTRLDETADTADLEAYATPQPGWLWCPERTIPAAPAAVRVDGGVLVITTAAAHPRREIFLERPSGRVLRVEDTDATGRVIRIGTCADWRRVGSVWLPYRIEETVAGTAGGVRRTWGLTACATNTPLTEADFALP